MSPVNSQVVCLASMPEVPSKTCSKHMVILKMFSRLMYMRACMSACWENYNLGLCHGCLALLELPKYNKYYYICGARKLCTETVNKCLWLQMARKEMDYNWKNLG